jgi:hypothetical protein
MCPHNEFTTLAVSAGDPDEPVNAEIEICQCKHCRRLEVVVSKTGYISAERFEKALAVARESDHYVKE